MGGYRRYIPPREDLWHVEYDLDSSDEDALEKISKRVKNSPGQEAMEATMDKLEKLCFENEVLRGHHSIPADEIEDDLCAVCRGGDSIDSDRIVFCDNCNKGVHQCCYGIPNVPLGMWLCRGCSSQEKRISCVLCPVKDFVFKRTVDGRWAHLQCALWIPETSVVSEVLMEPIDHIDNVPKARWRLLCSICGVKRGACIQCSHPSCTVAYHVTCAQQARLYMKITDSAEEGGGSDGDGTNNHNDNDDDVTYTSFCLKHHARAEASGDEDSDEPLIKRIKSKPMKNKPGRPRKDANPSHHHNHQQQQQQQQQQQGGAAVDCTVMSKETLSGLAAELSLPTPFVGAVYDHWRKKRSKRGVLIKRLEASLFRTSLPQIRTEKEAEVGLELVKAMSETRNNLERARLIVDVVKRREAAKLRLHENAAEVARLLAGPRVAEATLIAKRAEDAGAVALDADQIDRLMGPEGGGFPALEQALVEGLAPGDPARAAVEGLVDPVRHVTTDEDMAELALEDFPDPTVLLEDQETWVKRVRPPGWEDIPRPPQAEDDDQKMEEEEEEVVVVVENDEVLQVEDEPRPSGQLPVITETANANEKQVTTTKEAVKATHHITLEIDPMTNQPTSGKVERLVEETK